MSDDARRGRVVITGATGLVGVPLVKALRADGYAVTALVRDVARAQAALGDGVTLVEAKDLENVGPWLETLAGAHAIVHLAGESVAGKRWDARRKQIIRDSRVESTRMIVEHLETVPKDQLPEALITASGIDYYAFAARNLTGSSFDDADDAVTEAAPAGDGFLSRVCDAWELEAAAIEELGVRVARLRIGVVIAAGGALSKMTTPFKLFAGGRIGSGKQWFSWVHLDDVVAAFRAAVSDERYRGPINVVAPGAVRNRELAQALGKALHRPAWLPVPGFALKAAVGELAEYLLEGRRAVPAALAKLGFTFTHPTLPEALRDALGKG